ncbi:MAG: DUF6265 family protein, partial [Arenimonas sp.]
AFPAAAPGNDDIHDAGFAWLAGHWCGMQDGAQIEELWLERGGQLFNVSTSTRDGALLSFEYARIEARAGGVVYVAQPGGAAPVEFALVEEDDRRVVFTNPGHDFPQQVSYWRDDAGLHAEIAGPGEAGEQRIGFDYAACPAAVAVSTPS